MLPRLGTVGTVGTRLTNQEQQVEEVGPGLFPEEGSCAAQKQIGFKKEKKKKRSGFCSVKPQEEDGPCWRLGTFFRPLRSLGGVALEFLLALWFFSFAKALKSALNRWLGDFGPEGFLLKQTWKLPGSWWTGAALRAIRRLLPRPRPPH